MSCRHLKNVLQVLQKQYHIKYIFYSKKLFLYKSMCAKCLFWETSCETCLHMFLFQWVSEILLIFSASVELPLVAFWTDSIPAFFFYGQGLIFLTWSAFKCHQFPQALFDSACLFWRDSIKCFKLLYQHEHISIQWANLLCLFSERKALL